MTTVDGPFGATPAAGGTDFRVFSLAAERIELCVFDADGREARHALAARPGGVWHCRLEGVGPGTHYGYRVHAPYAPERGLRCDPKRLLVDPYAKAVTRQGDWGQGMFSYRLGTDGSEPSEEDGAAEAPRSIVVDDAYDWGADRSPAHPAERTVIYELHVKGFTARHPGVPDALRGTYAGLAHPAALDEIQRLGVTTVELMPVQQFAHEPHLLDQGLRNYWGYHPYAYFAPHAEYAAGGDGGAQVPEFKALVAAMHARGLEVIVDVVYNHTAEGNHLGPTLNFKGFDNATYYHLVGDDPRYYMDFTGTGNSLNLRHPVTLQLVMDSLRYWVAEMHVDGFRFDLATTLARGLDSVDTWAAFFAAIHQDPLLRGTKLIAEPWDVGHNGYQVGNFPYHWSEWNDRYRESVRRCWSGGCDRGEIARRIMASPDLFEEPGRMPSATVNYVSSHDGLTLKDLVDAQLPHDGEADAAAAVEPARARRQRNLLATVLLSRGTPMLAAGDERGRTQGGHDNAYDQDNERSWLDWAASDDALVAFTQAAIALRRDLPWTQVDRWADPELTLRWLRPDGTDFTGDDWAETAGALCLLGVLGSRQAVWLLNPTAEAVSQVLPDSPAGWRVALDTAAAGATPAVSPFALGPDRMVVLVGAGGSDA